MIWSSFLETGVTERSKKSTVAKVSRLRLFKSCSKVLRWSVGIEPTLKSMWNTFSVCLFRSAESATEVISLSHFIEFHMLLRPSTTSPPPAFPGSVDIKNCNYRYSGGSTFLGKSKFDSTVSINYTVGSYLLLPRNVETSWVKTITVFDTDRGTPYVCHTWL